MSGDVDKPRDLRFATNEERRFALAYLRWLAGGGERRGSEPSPPTPPTRCRRPAASKSGRTSRAWSATPPIISAAG